jgi:hypothetical protein
VAARYRCVDERRREAVRAHPGDAVNGIDYLEVDAGQRTLSVYLLKPLSPASGPLTMDRVVIDGGVRVTHLRVVEAFAVDRVLTVQVDRPGDFSTYRLSLVSSSTDPSPPAGFDPMLADIEFSFKVGCPSDFDCEATPPANAPPPPPGPSIDYLAKDYASFRRLMLDRLSVVLPGWEDQGPADLGVTIVELLAYAGDHLSYLQDAVATEAYLGTARRRSSVRRHARLVDYFVHDGVNARSWVCLEVSGDLGSPANPAVPVSTVLLTGAGPVVVDPVRLDEALAGSPVVFETLHPLAELRVARNEVRFYTWGDRGCWLPEGATSATLDADAASLGLVAGDVLVLEEVLGPLSGLADDADPTHRQAVRLRTDPVERVDLLTGAKVLDVAWHDQDALRFPMSLAEFEQGGRLLPTSVVRANVVLADHGRTLPGEALDPPAGPRDRPALRVPGLTQWLPYDSAAALRSPAAAQESVDLRRAAPHLRLEGGGLAWRLRRDLLGSGRFSADFVVETESDGRTRLRFGDGVHGRRPTPGSHLTVTYRVGGGRAGNLGADTIRRVVAESRLAAVVHAVRNPMPAYGGMDPEPLEHVRLAAPQAFRTQERAVTEDDYAAVAQRHPEVQRAVATSRWTGSWHTIFVTIDRRGGRPVDAAFADELVRFIDPYRMAGYDLAVDGPRFVPLDIALTVCVDAGHARGNVRNALLERFSAGYVAGGGRGFFHPDNFTFGQPVYLSQVVAAAMQVPGVRWVDSDDLGGKPNRFRRWGRASDGELAAARIAFARLEIARLDNDPNQPEHGQIEFLMEGGL